MRVRAAVGVAVLATGVAAIAVIPAASGSTTPVRKVVKVGDDYYSPLKVRVPKGSTIVWKWLNVNGNTHDVKLKSGPKGVRHFKSDPAATYFSYKRKLRVSGKYSIICTFHENMTMTVIVR
jgi:plastocyanin